ncbi:MAG TPA: hypothetical protein VFE30_12610 [Anaeromyxobacteraceae bacterium]|jgi:hypothetical protein|nr:hypothetical protein [Anaeromyxobacteraceae bacterium]
MHTFFWFLLASFVAFVLVRLARRGEAAATAVLDRFIDAQVAEAVVRMSAGGAPPKVQVEVRREGSGSAQVTAIIEHAGATTRASRTVSWDELPAPVRAEFLRTGAERVVRPWSPTGAGRA